MFMYCPEVSQWIVRTCIVSNEIEFLCESTLRNSFSAPNVMCLLMAGWCWLLSMQPYHKQVVCCHGLQRRFHVRFVFIIDCIRLCVWVFTCDWFHWVAQGWEIEVWKIHIQGCYIFRSSLWSSVLRWKRLYKKAPFQLWFRRISDRRGELQVTPKGPLFGFLAQLASQ